MKKLLSCLLLTLITGAAVAASPAPIAAERGMVVTAQQYATRIGVDVLKQGGNAIDAAVAVGYALAVVYPAAGNLGGGGFMTVMFADGRRAFIDFREKAPLAATANMFLDAQGNVVPDLSTRGHLAVAVPGTVAGLEYIRAKYGTRPLRTLIDPAIRLAERGFVLAQGDAEMLWEGSADFRKDAASAAIFLHAGKPWQPGDTLKQPDLARTLKLIRARGAPGFYQGETAAKLVAASRAGGGILSQADLDAYDVREMPPLECDYRGFRIVSAPPPSSGGVVICEILNVLEGYPLPDYGWGSARAIHVQIEAMRQAYIDRNQLLGDQRFVKNPVDQMLDKAYGARIRAGIDPQRAGISTKLVPGAGFNEGSHTTHYSIADSFGNAVAVTYTLNDWFGARVTAGGTGVLLNNEMDDFTAKVGVPNLYGLVQGENNRIEPGKRPLSSMAPTIVVKDRKPWMILGTPGGSRIITAVTLTLLNVIDYGMDLQEAVDAPRIHQQWLPEETYVEARALSADTRAILESMGHRLTVPQPENHVAAILIGAPALNAKPVGGNRFYGAIDPRRNTGLAAGY
ncbi:MAG: ggt [Steroidobacteraceae bacterium]|jgi:gamma-glutamyltranspeptidase/glutathione hydrolase|nr:ggt [Steroidobacteraceae bacterium]